MKKSPPLDPSLPGKYGKMTARDFAKLSARYNKPNSVRAFKTMTEEERTAYENRIIKHAGGRPRKSDEDKVIKVNVSFDPQILKLADAYAKRKKLTRANLIETALVKLLGRPARKFDVTPRKRKSA